jgi:two-component system cell cycle sensor histidine kinase/response regulator CckA
VKKSKRVGNKTTVPADLLAAAVRAQADGVFIGEAKASTEGLKIVFANESFCDMTGFSGSELAGMHHGRLHADKTEVVKSASWDRRARAHRPLIGEGYIMRKDGGTIYAAWSFSPVVRKGGRLTHVVATYRDTTEKRRLQEALVHSQRLDAVGRLAGGVAHDFNNLISVINGYCEMLAAKISDRPQALRELNEIHKSGLRAAALTRQLLAFGRRQPLDARVTNFNRIVQENAEIMARLVGSAGQLEIDLAKDLENVRADPTQFQQVLLNLVINARDALRDKGRIVISTSNREVKAGRGRVTDVPPGEYVCLTVKDNGTGMDAETQRHLFEPFFTTKAEGEGTGLGLALVYGIVQESNGYIHCHSAVLAGSTFEIFLPRVREPEDSAVQSVPLPTASASRGHETLLVIEKDDVVRKMLAGMLTAEGYRVFAAEAPKQARKLAREVERPIQLLIADLNHDGAEFARELYAEAPTLRLLSIGNQDIPAPVDWLEATRQAGLSKPFALSEISRNIRSLLDA